MYDHDRKIIAVNGIGPATGPSTRDRIEARMIRQSRARYHAAKKLVDCERERHLLVRVLRLRAFK